MFCCFSGLALRQSFIKALRSSPFLPTADLLQVAILLCWGDLSAAAADAAVAGAAAAGVAALAAGGVAVGPAAKAAAEIQAKAKTDTEMK